MYGRKIARPSFASSPVGNLRAKMRAFICCAALAAALQSSGSAVAQVYPSRPLTVIVPFAAGGPTDTLARVLAERMKTSLGQPVIRSIYRPGSAGCRE